MLGQGFRAAIGRGLGVATLIVGLSASSANAASITFNLNGGLGEGPGPGNQLSVSSAGVTVYASAWYANTNSFHKAALGQYSSGMGVCNGEEDGFLGTNGSFPCDVPFHAIDNHDQRDFLLLLFSTPVDMASLEVVEILLDADVSYWFGNVGGAANQTELLTGKALNNMPAGFGSRYDNNGGTRTFYLDNTSNTYNALLIGASLADSHDYDDFFKVKTVTVNYNERTTTDVPVPEPASLVMLGSGLVGLATVIRRSAKRRS